MKRRIFERWFAASGMGEAGEGARKTQIRVIILLLAAIALSSAVLFMGRLIKDKDGECEWTVEVRKKGVPVDTYRGNYNLSSLVIYLDEVEAGYCYKEIDGREVILDRELPKDYSVILLTIDRATDFSVMMRGVYVLLPVCLALAIAAVIINYRSFYRPTRSIYVMRRLRDGGELHRRCLTIPLVGLIAAVILCVVLTVVYYKLYFRETMPVRLPNKVTFNVWRTLVWWS